MAANCVPGCWWLRGSPRPSIYWVCARGGGAGCAWAGTCARVRRDARAREVRGRSVGGWPWGCCSPDIGPGRRSVRVGVTSLLLVLEIETPDHAAPERTLGKRGASRTRRPWLARQLIPSKTLPLPIGKRFFMLVFMNPRVLAVSVALRRGYCPIDGYSDRRSLFPNIVKKDRC